MSYLVQVRVWKGNWKRKGFLQMPFITAIYQALSKEGCHEVIFPLHVTFASCSLGPLVSKVKEYQVETIVDTLCTNMLSDKEQLRDISSIGLKTVISELPPPSTGKKVTLSVYIMRRNPKTKPFFCKY